MNEQYRIDLRIFIKIFNFRGLTLMGLMQFVISCASTHPGSIATVDPHSERLPLIISAEIIDNHEKNDPFQLIGITFENEKDNWVRIKNSELIIDNPAESGISVVVGEDLNEWANAMAFRVNRDKHNSEMTLLALDAIGAAALISGTHNKNSNLQAIGGVTTLASTTWRVTDDINQSINQSIKQTVLLLFLRIIYIRRFRFQGICL